MPAAQRLGDDDNAGAAITSVPQDTVFINNLPASINGSTVAGHGKGAHSDPVTANGSSDVFINGVPVNRTGDADSCGHIREGGSPNVSVD